MKIKKLLLLLSLTICLSSCQPRETITHTDTIVSKEIKSELNNAATWWLEVPIQRSVFYFMLEKYGQKEVNQITYNQYKIGDIYTWEEWL